MKNDMHLRSLYLQNFRIFDEAFFEFVPGINSICGDNARGKTTILEAIYLLITGRSFRSAQTADLLRHGAAAFRVEACFVRNGIEQTLKMAYAGKEKHIVHNNTVFPSATALLGLLKGIVLSPDDAGLVKGSPGARRQYLDIQIAQVDPLYIHHLTRYGRAMRQRNHLLRVKQEMAIESWEQEMAHSAAYLTVKRLAAAAELHEAASRLHTSLTAEEAPFALQYKSSASPQAGIEGVRKYFSGLFSSNRRRELLFGYTLHGPHKDDLSLEIDGKEARFFASEGQQRSCAAILRLAEWERVRTVSEEIPLMLIDDAGISLDDSRRGRLLRHIEGLGQVFLTATGPLSLPGQTIAL
jgi:DNA replication and repair protein RecF